MKEQNITLKQLRYYLTTARHSSIRQAAAELRITQPSLSAQLKLFEESLGVELFERSRGGIALTPLGRELINESTAAVNAVEAVIDAATFASKGPTGTFRLGVSPALGPYSLPWILPAVRHKFTGVKFFVREDVPAQLANALVAGKYDLIFSPLPIEATNVTVMPLFREPIYLVTNIEHPLAKYNRIKPDQLANVDILAIEEHHHFYKQVEDICFRFKAHLLRDYEGTSLDAIRQMVYMEMGAAFLPALYIRSELRDRDELKVLGIEGEPIYRMHALAWRDSSPLRNFYRELGKFFQAEIKKKFSNDVLLT